MPAATMAWLIPGLIGAGGLFMQQDANRRAKNMAEMSQQLQAELAGRQVALFDRIQKRYEEMKAGGAFSPEKRLDQLDKDTAQYEGRDLGNLAGAMRVAGYRAGDSEVGGRLDAVKGKYRSERERLANQIRREATNDEMAAMQGQASMGSSLNAAMDVYGNRASQFRSQIQDLTPGVMSLAEAFKGMKAARAPSAQPPAAASSSGSLGSGGYMNYRPPSGSSRDRLRNMTLGRVYST